MRFIPRVDGLETRLAPGSFAPTPVVVQPISDPSVPVPPPEPPDDPDPPPEPSPGPFPGTDPPIPVPPPPIGGPVGPA